MMEFHFCQVGAFGREQNYGGMGGVVASLFGVYFGAGLAHSQDSASCGVVTPDEMLGVGAFSARRKQLFDELRADPELGGAEFNQTIAHCRVAADHFGVPDLQAILMEADLDVDVRMLRFVARVGASVCPGCAQARQKGRVVTH
jgi:hypothetical protein